MLNVIIRRGLLLLLVFHCFQIHLQAYTRRGEWVRQLVRIAGPVVRCAAHDSLRIVMPVHRPANRQHQYLEALGRTVCGIAPWLELPVDDSAEGIERAKYRDYTLQAITHAVNPAANDYMDFSAGNQSLVDAAYLAQGLLRAPHNLWGRLSGETQQRVIAEMEKTRRVEPAQNNWLLFASMIEAFLLEHTGRCDMHRLTGGFRFMDEFYKGDGIYGDGADMAMDYYNSFVIHPMLTDILLVGERHGLRNFSEYMALQRARLRRYAALQERTVSPEGAFPLMGRTLICRMGAFHALAQAALLDELPQELSTGQVRAAMSAVLMRLFAGNENFDRDGFLTIGFNGRQDSFVEDYVSSGSPYHCVTFFLPLGLAPESDFWQSEAEPWTSLKAFSGEDFQADHAYQESRPSSVCLAYRQLSARWKMLLPVVVGVCLVLNILGVCHLYQIIKRKAHKLANNPKQ